MEFPWFYNLRQDFFVQETESQILDRQLDALKLSCLHTHQKALHPPATSLHSVATKVVVDAIDGVANKCRLIYACYALRQPVAIIQEPTAYS